MTVALHERTGTSDRRHLRETLGQERRRLGNQSRVRRNGKREDGTVSGASSGTSSR